MSIHSIVIYTISTHENQLPQVRYIAKALSEYGYDVTVVGPLGPTCRRDLEASGVRVDPKPVPRIAARMRAYQLFRTVDVILNRKKKCDLALGIDSSGLVLAYLAFLLGRATRLGAYFLEYDPPECFRWQITNYPHLVAPTMAERLSLLIDVDPERLQARRNWMQVPEHSLVLRNVASRSFLRSDPATYDVQSNRLRILYQGTLGSENGLRCLFDAFKQLNDDRVELTLAGHSNNSAALVNDIRQLFPGGNVRYAGLIDRSSLGDFISNHNIGIALYPWRHVNSNPGLALCAPNKLYEYMARGLPVICSDNPTLDFIESKRLGWRVNPEYPAQLTSVIEKILLNPSVICDYGKNAHKLCKHEWHFEVQFSNLISLLHEL